MTVAAMKPDTMTPIHAIVKPTLRSAASTSRLLMTTFCKALESPQLSSRPLYEARLARGVSKSQ
jgi:hypothetical protein